jgi:CubicO group peptidase (beta-lactamase class C family)
LQVETSIQGKFEKKTLAEQLKRYNTPGISIAVINEGKIEWARGFGLKSINQQDSVDITTLFEAGSVSKPVFALGVMKLKEKGLIDLDKDINSYLTSWKVPKVQGWQPIITLRQLLSHTAGLSVHGFPGYLKTEAIPTLPQILNGETPANTGPVIVNILPGTTFRYSGGGTTVAQLSIMDVLKKPFPQIMREELFDKLKLPYSTYAQPLPDSLQARASTAFPYKGKPISGNYHIYPEMAAAGLWTNPSELATIVLEVQNALKGKSTVFKKETIEEMLTPQKIAPNIGIGFFLNSKGDSARFGHNGWDEGFVALLIAYKNQGKGLVVMVNSNEGYDLMDEIARAVAMEYNWVDFLPVKPQKTTITADEMKKYTGIYEDAEKKQFNLQIIKETLHLSYQNQAPIPLIKVENGYFYAEDFNFKLYFEENNQLKFEQQGNSVIYKRK